MRQGLLKVGRDSLFLYQKGQNNGVLYPESESVFFEDKTSEESMKFVKKTNQEIITFLWVLKGYNGKE
ncbi:hypothetical protein ATE84_4709 [Aquimarina sp. MAR_2010_214]|uniref:hypothetical protein n=1 Tax=Aquimarina sp. MAR_2010_214 TaxID=1250026 RepID=UPI000C6FDAC1|nr:hypothetical protein [Aquimarina sp. MAR_2010_214]PKV52589.1 hypothetical protein ATE84_4709 [Aquimarina sp. MAR_2010_214]